MRQSAQPYPLVIFDLDGTLVDSFPWFLRIVNDVAREFDFKPVETGDIAGLRRSGAREILKHLELPLWKVPRVASYMRRLKREYLAEIPVFPGVPEMLESLRSSGVRIALVSSDSEANARVQLGDTAEFFSDFACGASLFGKTAKFKRIVKRAGLTPSSAIAIGDEMRDMDAADATGIAFGGVAWGYTEPEALRACRPQLWFDTMPDITRILTASATVPQSGP
jgi:phosphoglycolate phosphatase